MRVSLVRLWSAAFILAVLVAINPFGNHAAGPIATGSIPIKN